MPSPWKQPSSGRLGRLLAALRPGRAGPLPVQTGFPTSLADLVVKNHGRLKKPSSSKPKKRLSSPSPPTLAPPAAAVEPPTRPKSDLSPVQTVPHAAFSLRLEFLAIGGVVALALLVIWSKKLVAAVTFASFLLFLLESVKSSAPRRPRPLQKPPVNLDLDHRGRVSPIREVESEATTPRPSCADSDRGSVVSIPSTESCEAGDDSRNPKAKKKSSWRKLIANKLHNGKNCKNKEEEEKCCHKQKDSSGSFYSEGNQADGTLVDTNAILIGIETSKLDVTEETNLDLRSKVDRREITLSAVVSVAVVLLGLVAGKLPAVALATLCFAFFSSAERSSESSDDLPGR